MKNYKLTPLIMLLASLSTTGSNASYSLVYPLDNIKFTNIAVVQEQWSAGEPTISEWVMGAKDCSNWSPAASTKHKGHRCQLSTNSQ